MGKFGVRGMGNKFLFGGQRWWVWFSPQNPMVVFTSWLWTLVVGYTTKNKTKKKQTGDLWWVKKTGFFSPCRGCSCWAGFIFRYFFKPECGRFHPPPSGGPNNWVSFLFFWGYAFRGGVRWEGGSLNSKVDFPKQIFLLVGCVPPFELNVFVVPPRRFS